MAFQERFFASKKILRIRRIIILLQSTAFSLALPLMLFCYVFGQIPQNMSGEHFTDLTVNARLSSYQAFPGELVEFIITVDNLGPSNARDVYLEVTLPEEVEYQNLEPIDGLTVKNNLLTWTINSFLAGQTNQLAFTGKVNQSLSQEKNLTISAQIFSLATDLFPENNSISIILGAVLPSSIEGVVWGDIDKDGIRSPNERPSGDFVVELYSEQQLISQTHTSDLGRYQFVNLYPGEYYLNFKTQSSVLFSPKDVTIEAFDSDPFPDAGFTEVITLISGQHETSWDAGIFFEQFLPVIFDRYTPAPDLIVKRIEVDFNSNFAEIEIENVGSKATSAAFWVDLYIDPDPVPTGTNQPCHSSIACQGTLVWGITQSVSIFPGGSIVIFTGDKFFSQTYSTFTGQFDEAMNIYVQVDSDNKYTDYGNILETHEIYGQPYNNIARRE